MCSSTAAEPEPPLEREHELAAIHELLEQSGAGRGGLVVVEGPAGIGKTRLVQAAVGLARARGSEVLRAVGGELERELAFGVALQLFEPRLRRASAAERGDLLSGAAALAAPLLRITARSPGERAEALSLFHGLFWVTCNLAERVPVLIAVDDAQWADQSSLECLLYLAQRLEELPVALLVTSRPDDAGPTGALLARIAGHPLARTLRPAPLSERAVGALVRQRFPTCAGEFVHACARATGGNPFLVRELLSDLEAARVKPTAATARDVAGYVPEAITRSVLVRLARLPVGADALACAVAVLGDHAALRHAAALADQDIDRAVAVVNALSRAGILVPSEPLAFVHPLLRSSLDADTPQPERERMHARAARLLAAEGAPAERVAAHLLHTRPLADGWVVDQLRHAGRAAMARGAPSSAVTHLLRALAEPPPPAMRVSVLMELADAETAAGAPEAPDHLAEAATLVRENEEHAQILLRLGGALYLRGRLEQAADAFDQGLGKLSGGEEVVAELQAGWLAVACLLPALAREAEARFARVIESPPAGATHGERVLLAHLAELLLRTGEPRARVRALALRALGNGALLASETADGATWMIAEAVLKGCEDYEAAEQLLDAATADARRRGSVVGFANASFARSWIDYQSGRLRDAIADVEQVIDATRYGWKHYLPSAHVVLAQVLLERAQVEAADSALDQAAAGPGLERTVLHGYVLATRGRLRLHQGHPREALELLLAAGRSANAAEAHNPAVGAWRSGAALAAARLGDLKQAQRLAREEVELARRFGAPGALGVALRAMGIIERGEAGIERLRDAVTALERSPLRLEHARALVDLGAALRRQGKRAEARAPLSQGLDMAHRFAATLLERHAHQELLASGARPRRTALRGVEALTPSEHRVAQLAAAGRSNREIAQALFITLRTVEGHLSRAYDKLGVRSRDQLAPTLDSTSPELAPQHDG